MEMRLIKPGMWSALPMSGRSSTVPRSEKVADRRGKYLKSKSEAKFFLLKPKTIGRHGLGTGRAEPSSSGHAILSRIRLMHSGARRSFRPLFPRVFQID